MENFVRKYRLLKLTLLEITFKQPNFWRRNRDSYEEIISQKIPRHRYFTGEFHQTLKVQIVPMLHKLFQNLKNWKTFQQTRLIKSSITLSPQSEAMYFKIIDNIIYEY